MIGGDKNINALGSIVYKKGYFFKKNINRSQLNTVAGERQNIQIVNTGTKRSVRPFEKMKSLAFGTKVSTLIFSNEIRTNGHGIIVANGMLGVRNGNSIQLRSAYGISQVQPKTQYNVVKYKKCKKRFLRKKKCWTETKKIARGFYHNEIESIVYKLQREAAVQMRSSLGLGFEEESTSLGSLFLSEYKQLKSLYSEIVYEYTDVSDIPAGDLNKAIHIQSRYLTSDAAIRNRMVQHIQANSRSNFLYMPNYNELFIYSTTKVGANYNMHIGYFKVGGRLPKGAFLTRQVGKGWIIERAGQAAKPSVHQIKQVFSGFK